MMQFKTRLATLLLALLCMTLNPGCRDNKDSTENTSLPELESKAQIDALFKQGQPVSLQLFKAEGGRPSLNYSLSPDLPQGLRFNSDAYAIIGTPTQVHSQSNYTYKVTDAKGRTDDWSFNISVKAADVVPRFSTTTTSSTLSSLIDRHITLTQNQNMQPHILPQAINDDGTFIYSLAPRLPQGLEFNPITRQLSGVPTQLASPVLLSYRVISQDGGTDIQFISLQVRRLGEERASSNQAALKIVTYDRGGFVYSGAHSFLSSTPQSSIQFNNLLLSSFGRCLLSRNCTHSLQAYNISTGQYEDLAEGFNFDATQNNLRVEAGLPGRVHLLLHRTTDEQGQNTYTHILLGPQQPFNLLQGGVDWSTFNCDHKHIFSQIKLNEELTFNVNDSSQTLLKLGQRAAQRWTQALGLQALRVQDSTASMDARDGDGQSSLSNYSFYTPRPTLGGWLAFARPEFSDSNLWHITAVDIVFNPFYYAKLENQNNLEGESFYTMLHEMGHALGLGHSDNKAHLMYKDSSSTATNIHPDEVKLIRCLYEQPEASQSLLSQFVPVATGAQAKPRATGSRVRNCGHQLQAPMINILNHLHKQQN